MMIPRYRIKDIVKVNNIEGVYYIITNFVSFTNIEGIKGINYRLVKIHPISSVVESIIVNEEDVSIVASRGTHQYSMIIDILNERYNRIGCESFSYFMSKAMLPSNDNKDVAKGETVTKRRDKIKTKNNDIYIPEQIQDAIYYHEINNIDECLDAMNDLKALYETFGDEAYLQLLELVMNRFKKLIKKIDSVDKCLDAMNNLNALYGEFNNKSYLQTYKLVVNRLEQLTKKKG